MTSNATRNENATVDIVFYSIIVFLGITGNSLVIWVTGFRMKPSVTNVWLLNLAVADLIFCITRIISLIKILFFDYWSFGIFLCKFNGFFKYANMFCSVFLLAVISVDRVLCVWRPVFTRKRRTLCAARVVSLCVWIVAIIFSTPYFMYRQVYPGNNNLSKCSLEDKKAGSSGRYAYYIIRFVCGFLLPFLVILICYILAGVGIRRTRITGKTRPLRILAVLVCAFFICWAPYHFLHLIKLVNKDSEAVKSGKPMASNLAYFNSCVNPVLYFCMGLDVRKRCNQSLSGIYQRALAEEDQTLQDGTLEENCTVYHKRVSMDNL